MVYIYPDPLDRKNDFDSHIFSLLHELTINQDLISSDSVAHSICRVGGCGNLNLSPFTVGGYEFALGSTVLEFFIDALFFDTAFSLD